MKQYTKVPDHLANSEVEGEETMLSPQGLTFEFKGPSHEKGGIPALLPQGTKVFSKKLKLPKQTVKEITGKDKKMSPADMTKMYANEKYEKIINDQTGRYDTLAKKTAALMMSKNFGKMEDIFQAQEDHKANKGPQFSFFQLGGEKNPWDLTGLSQEEYNSQSGDFVTKEGKYFFKAPNGSLYDIYSQYPQEGGAGNPTFNTETEKVDYFKDQQLFTKEWQDLQKEVATKGKNGKLYNNPVVKNYQEKVFGVSGYNSDGSYKYDMSDDSKFSRKEEAKHYLNQHGDPSWKHISIIGVKPDGTKVTLAKNGNILDSNMEGYVDFELPGAIDSDHVHMQQAIYRRQKESATLSNPIWKPNDVEPLPSKIAQITSTPVLPERTFKEPTKDNPERGPMDPYPVMQAMNIMDLLNVKRANPYYAYSPSELAYTRYEPINIKSNELAFQNAVRSIEQSGLPEQVKQARIADAAAQMQQGVNQTNLTNFQGDLANDNANVERYNQYRNHDIQARTQANYQYAQESERADFNVANQRQVYKDQILNMWKDRFENNFNTDMISQMFPGYKFDWRTKSIQRIPGYKPVDYDVLSNYGGSSDVYSQVKAQHPEMSSSEIVEYIKALRSK